MRWLITMQAKHDASRLSAELQKLGVTVDLSKEPVPLDSGEWVYTVDGPSDLNVSAKKVRGVVRVNPASRVHLFREGRAT
ncbi:MAG: hypothetical protein ACREJY_01620 [Candidatus Rokuibacteriota bacterium]